jgi:hypothetical protein
MITFARVTRPLRQGAGINIALESEFVMSVMIFHTDSGSTETWLQVNDDGTVTYHEENSGVRMMRRGIEPRNRIMTGEEAKADWTSYAGFSVELGRHLLVRPSLENCTTTHDNWKVRL